MRGFFTSRGTKMPPDEGTSTQDVETEDPLWGLFLTDPTLIDQICDEALKDRSNRRFRDAAL